MALPHSHYLAWEPDDRAAHTAYQTWQGESCNECGVHPSIWDPKLGGKRNAVAPKWVFCRVCELIAQANEAGPPSDSKGWHLVLSYAS